MEINTYFWLFFYRKQWTTKKYADVCDGIKNEIKTINGGKENDYGKEI